MRSREPSQAVIIVRSIDTGEERELPVGERRLGTDLRWAPDGKALVVPGFEPGKKTPDSEASAGHKSLTRIDVQTGQATSLMPFPENVGGSPPFALSPDGRTVFYINLNLLSDGSPGRDQLLARDVRSGQETELFGKKGLYSVSLPPDGKWLVVGAREDRSQVLLVMPAAGGKARELVRTDDEEANYLVSPSWTPDGRYVVFGKNLREPAKRPPRVQVWRVAADGGVPQPTGLTVDGLAWVRLHPDGRRVAIGTRRVSTEVWVMENFLPVPKGTPVASARTIKK
jgi:Tol biopolymer transport system component